MPATPVNPNTPVTEMPNLQPYSITITPTMVANLLAAFQMYNAGIGVRNIQTLTFPGGTLVEDTITYTNPLTKLVCVLQTQLACVAPGVALNTLGEDGIIVPPPQNIPQNLILPGVNDFNVQPNPGVVNTPIHTAVLIGPSIPNGDGSPSNRFEVLNNPADNFTNGMLYFTNGNYYQKNIVATPFGNSQFWLEVTVVGGT